VVLRFLPSSPFLFGAFSVGWAGCARYDYELLSLRLRDGAPDAAPSAPTPYGDAGSASPTQTLECPFGTPEILTGLNVSAALWGPSLTADGTTLFFAATLAGQAVYSAARSGRGTSFEAATPVSEVNGSGLNGTPFISADGLTLYTFSTRAGGVGDRDLWAATRPDVDTTFSPPELLAGVNDVRGDHLPTLTADELILVWESFREGGAGDSDLWTARRTTRSEPFGAPSNVSELNTPAREGGPSLSADGLVLYFTTDRGGGLPDIWVADRDDPGAPFENAHPVAAVNSIEDEHDPFLSVDGSELYFSSDRSGSQALWRVARSCP
jgi:hypothetical protein